MTSRSVILVQCLWCLALVECARVVPTEAEKQSAFEQLLGKTGRLRMQSSYQSFDPLTTTTTTTTLPPARPSTTPIMLSDEEAKRHDRRHAVLPQKKHNHKKNHSKRLHHAGRHVCTHEETVTRPIRVVESYCKPAYKSFTQRCSNGTMCTAFRVQYDTIYRTVVKYQTTIETKHACCPGWTHTPKHTHGCLQAVCTKGCKNGGVCVKPNTCNCPPGYTGPTCESDLDECSSNAYNRCQQICTNSVGSYQCACHEGFQLQQDNRTCKFRLELVPELQHFLANYESLSQRLAVLEQEPRAPIQSSQVDVVDYQSTIANMTQHIVSLEEKISKLQSETNMLIANSSNLVESNESSNSDSLTSLSEQVAILEERLADCTCTTPVDNKVKTRS